MDYVCPVCGTSVSENLREYIEHTEKHVIDVIKLKHPEWVEKDGLCHKCLDYYKKEMKG